MVLCVFFHWFCFSLFKLSNGERVLLYSDPDWLTSICNFPKPSPPMRPGEVTTLSNEWGRRWIDLGGGGRNDDSWVPTCLLPKDASLAVASPCTLETGPHLANWELSRRGLEQGWDWWWSPPPDHNLHVRLHRGLHICAGKIASMEVKWPRGLPLAPLRMFRLYHPPHWCNAVVCKPSRSTVIWEFTVSVCGRGMAAMRSLLLHCFLA